VAALVGPFPPVQTEYWIHLGKGLESQPPWQGLQLRLAEKTLHEWEHSQYGDAMASMALKHRKTHGVRPQTNDQKQAPKHEMNLHEAGC